MPIYRDLVNLVYVSLVIVVFQVLRSCPAYQPLSISVIFEGFPTSATEETFTKGSAAHHPSIVGPDILYFDRCITPAVFLCQ